MKILHILNSNCFSGAENVVCQIIKLFENDPEIDMAYASPEGKIRDALSERKIKFFPIDKMTKKGVKKVIEQYKPDIIYTHDMRASFFGALACGRIPIISHIHNNAFDSRGISLKSIAYFYAGKKAEHIFWVSKSSYEGYIFKKMLKNKSTVLSNIIDIDALYEKMSSDSEEYDYDVVYVGRLTYPKNPQRLMTIFKELKEKKSDVKIAVIGTGELENEVKDQAEKFDLCDNVYFLGFLNNPYKIMHDSKVMIMASRWEGTPMCALEAMALGLPIVSTPVDGLKDLVKNGNTGFLVSENHEFVEKITLLIENQNMQIEISKKAIEVSHRLNNKTSYKQIIERVIRDIKI